MFTEETLRLLGSLLAAATEDRAVDEGERTVTFDGAGGAALRVVFDALSTPGHTDASTQLVALTAIELLGELSVPSTAVAFNDALSKRVKGGTPVRLRTPQ